MWLRLNGLVWYTLDVLHTIQINKIMSQITLQPFQGVTQLPTEALKGHFASLFILPRRDTISPRQDSILPRQDTISPRQDNYLAEAR